MNAVQPISHLKKPQHNAIMHHLLTLPREIRNLIYPYLSQPITTLGFREYGHTHITIHNAPLIPFMLVCKQLTTEYAESPLFDNICTTICWGSLGPQDRFRSFLNIIDAPLVTILRHTAHLAIYRNITGMSVPIARTNTFAFSFGELEKELLEHNLSFKTVKLGAHREYTAEMDLFPADSVGTCTGKFLGAPPPMLLGLGLRQHAHGYRHCRTTKFDVRDGVYLYTNEHKDADAFRWTKDETFEMLEVVGESNSDLYSILLDQGQDGFCVPAKVAWKEVAVE